MTLQPSFWEATMTKLEQQQAAVSMAVRAAMHKIGFDFVKRSEFFGTNQGRQNAVKQAA
ncbi:hypothetical protein GCM10011319_41740 [Mameliella alba]|nr:hypothetical protein GCM10011319_41740 [Mameliella alba]